MYSYYLLKDTLGSTVPSEGVSFENEKMALNGAIDYWGYYFTDIRFDSTWYAGDGYEFASILAKVRTSGKEGLNVSVGFVHRYL